MQDEDQITDHFSSPMALLDHNANVMLIVTDENGLPIRKIPMSRGWYRRHDGDPAMWFDLIGDRSLGIVWSFDQERWVQKERCAYCGTASEKMLAELNSPSGLCCLRCALASAA